MQNKKNLPLVSVSIPTLNSAKTIAKTLDSLKNQTYKNIEIIIGDGGSKDDTVKIARKYGAIICYGKALGKARFEILQKARGKYVITIDSDQYVGKTLIERAVKKMEKNDYDGLILNEESVIGKNTFIEKLLAYDKWVVVSSKDHNPLFGAEIPRMFKRKNMLTFKWPKTVSILDDAILFKDNLAKLKNVGYLGGDGIKHKEVDDFFVFFKKFMRYGKLYSGTLKVSGSTTLAHSLPRRNYFRMEVIKRPNVFLSLMILYLIKGVAVTCGIISYKLTGK
ncbi:MAG TPA: glycosyltransferase family 2 protein [Patescibacteria group bacterium]|nr:glycosyltransferase family 2 protein [Patescibacteria group bacterium]